MRVDDDLLIRRSHICPEERGDGVGEALRIVRAEHADQAALPRWAVDDELAGVVAVELGVRSD